MNAKISNTVKFKKNSARWRMLKSIMLESLKLNSEINGMWTTYNENENAARRATNGSNFAPFTSGSEFKRRARGIDEAMSYIILLTTLLCLLNITIARNAIK